MTFSIFESIGTSEMLADAFTNDFVDQFTKHTDLTKEEVLELLGKKLFAGGSDRASKMLKFGDIMKERLNHYLHFKCDNHVTETAWEEVQKLRRVGMVEDIIKQCFSLFKNSAGRKLRLVTIAKKLEERSLRVVGLFSIKYLTSEKDAVRSLLVDYLQLVKLTGEL